MNRVKRTKIPVRKNKRHSLDIYKNTNVSIGFRFSAARTDREINRPPSGNVFENTRGKKIFGQQFLGRPEFTVGRSVQPNSKTKRNTYYSLVYRTKAAGAYLVIWCGRNSALFPPIFPRKLQTRFFETFKAKEIMNS